MSDDVLITPASRKIEFYDNGGNIDGKIELSGAGDLNITSNGKITIGDITQDIHIGDGTQAVDLVFDFTSSLYSVAGQNLTLGKSSLTNNNIIVDSPNWSVSAGGNAYFSSADGSAPTGHFYRNDSTTQASLVKIHEDSIYADNPTLEIVNDRPGTNASIHMTGVISIKEQASAKADTASFGQLWVKTATPNELYFTNDAGDDIQLTSGSSSAGGGGGGAVSAVANGSNNRVATFSSADALNGEANLTFDGTTLDAPTITVDNLEVQQVDGDVQYGPLGGTCIHTGIEHLGLGGAVPHNMAGSGSDAALAIEYKTTVGTVDAHIALIGDSATAGQGPQIMFSESGNGQGFVGGTIGFARTGSNSMGDLIFSTRQSEGDATTTATEMMRLVGGTSPEIRLVQNITTTSNTNFNLYQKYYCQRDSMGTNAPYDLRVPTGGSGTGSNPNYYSMPRAGKIMGFTITYTGGSITTTSGADEWKLRHWSGGSEQTGTAVSVARTSLVSHVNANNLSRTVMFTAGNEPTFAANDAIGARRQTNGGFIVHASMIIYVLFDA